MKAWILIFYVGILSCGSPPQEATPAVSSSNLETESKGQNQTYDEEPGDVKSPLEPVANPEPLDPVLEELLLRYSVWLEWAPLCDGYPSKENCDDGDSTLFNGLLCASGEELGCEGVRLSQDDEGRFWRSPRRIDQQDENSFSRDMSLGVLLYLATTKDIIAAQKWLHWIGDQRQCIVEIGSVCVVYGYKFCSDDTDNRCTITPGIWATMYRVWEYLGLEPHEEMSAWLDTGENYYINEVSQAKPGFALHLKGVQAFLFLIMNQNLLFVPEFIDAIVKKDPLNPFFQLLKDGPHQELMELILDLCPVASPTRKFQWAWERSTEEEAWLESAGWDCIFIANLLRDDLLLP